MPLAYLLTLIYCLSPTAGRASVRGARLAVIFMADGLQREDLASFGGPIQAEGGAAQPPRNEFPKKPLELLLRTGSRLLRYTITAGLNILSLV